MIKEFINVKSLPLDVRSNQEIIQEAIALGCSEAKVILTKTIALGNWVKLQCQYGCPHFGRVLTCPPCSPTTDEMSALLMDYRKALLIHVKNPQNVHAIALNLEHSCRSKGFYKAFALCSGPCKLCEVCTIDTVCKYPDKARPAMQACGIDIRQTVSNSGWDTAVACQPCSDEHDIGMVLLD